MGNIEAILFASGDPVPIERISQVLDITGDETQELVESLSEKYNTDTGGIHLLILEDSVQFCTNSAYIDSVRKVLDMHRNTPLSQAALEVLSVVAYNQPVTKAFVEQIRGVDCAGVIGSLVEKRLLEECGRLELPGRPLLYRTTENFLRCFQLSSLSDLMPLPDRGEPTDVEIVTPEM